MRGVPVNDVVGVAILDSADDLEDDGLDLWKREGVVRVDEEVEEVCEVGVAVVEH